MIYRVQFGSCTRLNRTTMIQSGTIATGDRYRSVISLESLSAFLTNSRGDMIRTCDLLVPNQALYQAELRPECGSCQKPPKRSQSIAKTDKRQSSKEKSREQGTFLVFEELQQAFEFLRTTEWDDNSSCSFAVCMNHDFCANSSPKLIFK